MTETANLELVTIAHGTDLHPPTATTERFRPGVVVWIAVGWLTVVAVMAILADLLPLADPLRPNPRRAAAVPGFHHWFGTDALGRDMFARVVFGARTSLFVAFTSVVVAASIGCVLGFVAGYLRGRVTSVIMGVLDIMLAFPALILALALTTFLGPGAKNVVLAISFVAIPIFGRLARAQTLSYRQRDFVTASLASGASSARTLFVEIVPNVAPPIIAFALVFAAVAIVIEGGLSFLGLGVPPPNPSWGGMIAAGQARLDRAPHISLIPAVVMFVTVLSLNTVGETIRSYFHDADRGRS